MKYYHLKPTPRTPQIEFNPGANTFLISGRSIPENSIDFFKPAIDWLTDYLQEPLDKTILEVKLEYFNTSSSKCLVDIFRKIETLHKSGKEVQIKWYFIEEDEDMQESGEDFKNIIKAPVELIKTDKF